MTSVEECWTEWEAGGRARVWEDNEIGVFGVGC